jgi:hypothetical protein
VVGQSNSRPDLTVDIVVYVPAGQSASEASAAALESQNARPVSPSFLGSDGFSLNGVAWPSAPSQYYDDTNEPDWAVSVPPLGDLANAQSQWSTVGGSLFVVNSAGFDSRCPSLVRECDGPQSTDGFNGVAWLSLQGNPNVLGVAWRDTSAPEVDIALNLKFKWNQFGNRVAIANATMLHEEGHFAGAGHSQTSGTVMFASINTNALVDTLRADDQEVVRFLYPDKTVKVSGVVQLAGGGVAGGATVELIGTGFLTVETAVDGTFDFLLVPNNVHYDVVATLGGDSGSLDQVWVVSASMTFDLMTITLSSGDEGGGSGGFCPPGHARRDLC